MRKLLVVFAAVFGIMALTGCCALRNACEPKPKETKQASQQAAEISSTPKSQAKEASKQQKSGFTISETGLQYKDIKVGKGKAVKPGDTVVVHYKGWLNDGTVFDTSKQPGREPFSFTVGESAVIQGWHEGLQGMKVGGVRDLIIPPSLGYGESGYGPIPGNSTLNFRIELLKIE